MALTQEQISKTFELMQERSEAPKLTPEQLNAIDLLILGKTDREVSEIVGVRRETVTKWHKNPFFSAELSIQREELWVDAKLRLKSLAHEAVNVLTNGLQSSDEKIAITAAVERGQGHTVRKKGDRLEVWSREGKVSEAKLREVSQLSLYGGVEITTPAMVELMLRGVPVIHYTYGGWFQGICIGTTHKNVELRMHQFKWSMDPRRSILLAKKAVAGKIRNCRTLLRRNDPNNNQDTLSLLIRLAKDAEEVDNVESLLGIEGAAAEAYFSRFRYLLKSESTGFSFDNRNKRPPKGPVNAVLSYLYGILVKDLFVTLLAVGFDPYLGFYHRPRYGRPALALDMMEEFRPLIADSVAITLFNNGELSKRDFIQRGVGVSLTPDGKKTVVGGHERRMETEIIHPLFGYKVSYRRVLEVQARLLARTFLGEIKEYPPFCTR